MEGFAPLLIVFFIFFFNAVIVRKNAQDRKSRAGNVNTIPREVKRDDEQVVSVIDSTPVIIDEDEMGSVTKAQRPSNRRTNKPTIEKTHSHKGEVASAVLLEDRQHDWLAQQIREEARIGRKRMQ